MMKWMKLLMGCSSVFVTDFADQAWQADVAIASLTEVQVNVLAAHLRYHFLPILLVNKPSNTRGMAFLNHRPKISPDCSPKAYFTLSGLWQALIARKNSIQDLDRCMFLQYDYAIEDDQLYKWLQPYLERKQLELHVRSVRNQRAIAFLWRPHMLPKSASFIDTWCQHPSMEPHISLDSLWDCPYRFRDAEAYFEVTVNEGGILLEVR